MKAALVAMNTRNDAATWQRSRAPRLRRDEEHRLQVLCVRWFRLRYPALAGLLFAVPNGGRRDPLTGARLRDEGVTAGVADLILLKGNGTYNALCLEMKTGIGRQSQSQRQWQRLVEEQGKCLYSVCRTVDEFIKAVGDYMSYAPGQ